MAELKQGLWLCDYCGKGFNPNEEKYWVKKNVTNSHEANTKGTLCEDCVNYGIDLIDELDFNIYEGEDEERFRIFKEACEVTRARLIHKHKCVKERKKE